MDFALKNKFVFLIENIFIIDLIFVYLIWVVQLIVYPSFKFISADLFKDWHNKYCFRVGFFVLPLMLAQLLARAFKFYNDNEWFSFLIVSLTWISTFFISAPIHNKLKLNGKSYQLIDKLIITNWLRVFLWTTLLITS